MQAGVTDDLQQHSRLISSKVCHISLGSHLAHCRLKFKPVAKKKTHSVWKPNPCLCGLSGQREQTTVPLSVNRGRWFTERYRLLLRSCKIKCPLDTCQGVRFMPRGNKRAPNASLFYSRLGQPDLILKANFWKRQLRNKTMQFFFFFTFIPVLSPEPTYHGTDIQGQRSWKADSAFAVHTRNRASFHGRLRERWHI